MGYFSCHPRMKVVEVLSIQLSSRALSKMRHRIHIDVMDHIEIDDLAKKSAVNRELSSLARHGLPQSKSHPIDQELRRRKMALFFYLIRSPLFER